MTCAKCRKMCAWLVLLAGIGLLAVDLGYWDFYNISWYTLVFLILGVGKFATNSCSACQVEAKKKK